MTAIKEKGVVFRSGDKRLVGVSTVPEHFRETGLLVLVGGPQYRSGAHRQFTLMARDVAAMGIPVFRFDYAGMGDSEGQRSEIYARGDDISAAADALQQAAPGVKKIVLWGLCDAASSSLIYAPTDDRVCAQVLLNPWVHSGDYSPEVKLSHYYAPLLKGRTTWRRLLRGDIQVLSALRGLLRDSAMLLRKRLSGSAGRPSRHSFERLMLEGLEHFQGNSLFILSELDLTAREFSSLVKSDSRWRAALQATNVAQQEIQGADHTLSRPEWRNAVSELTAEWVQRQA